MNEYLEFREETELNEYSEFAIKSAKDAGEILLSRHGQVQERYVPVKTINTDGEVDTSAKIEYKIITEIEWAERFAKYMKKEVGNKISLLQFNNGLYPILCKRCLQCNGYLVNC